MTRAHTILRPLFAGAAVLALAASCQIDGGSSGETGGNEPPDGEPAGWVPAGEVGECNVDALLPPRSYGAKVKALITGLPLTAEELTTLDGDPEALAGLIDTWQATPEADAMMQRFFETAFQQNALDTESFFYLLGRPALQTGRFTDPTNSARVHEMLNKSFEESFARTVVELVKEGRPFHEVITTNRLMLTTAQMVYIAFTDDDVIDDEGERQARTTADDFPTLTIVRDQAAAPPPEEALNRNSPNFATFWHQGLADLDVSCNVAASQTIDTAQNTAGEWRIANGSLDPSFYVLMQIFGRQESISRHQQGCNSGADHVVPLLRKEDFTDWRMVTISPPAAGQDATRFYELSTLRGSNELRLHRPMKGFMTTPGFFGTWPNNEDNSSRVTINQILIVALGASFEGEAVSDFSPSQLDEEHAAPGTECYGCHQTLDPMRDFVRGSLTNFYGPQLDPEREQMAADFVFSDVADAGSGIEDLSAILASHPLFPEAWAQKLCYHANSAPCPEGEELDRVVAAFVESGFDFRTLVRELYSSPLVTGSACVAGVDAGTDATIARKSQFCGQLSHRLGIDDICGISTLYDVDTNLQDDVRDAVASVPDDAFSRAVVEPVVIAETSLFTRANREAACVLVAQEGFDAAFGEMTQEEVLDALVERVMGLPASDPRHDAARGILVAHAQEAFAAGASERDALESTFALACMAPGSAGVGF